MTPVRRKYLPRPRLSLFLLIIWMLLNNSTSFSTVFFGAILGWLIPLASAQFWPEDYGGMRYGLFFRYWLRVIQDIAIASMAVARLILGPQRRLQPAFVTYPLTLNDHFAITLLASTISLTPGTVSADISKDGKFLLIHALDVEDEAELIRSIRDRYEIPLGEIFQ